MNRWRLLLVALALAGVSGVASAAVFSEDFESYAVGNLHGQGGWKGWNNDPAATGKVTTKFAAGGTKSVEILGSSDFVHEFTPKGGRWTFTAKQYIPSGGTGETYFILLNTYADNGTDDWSIQTKYNLATGVITCEMGSPIAKATEVVFDRWVEIKILIDLDKNTFQESYNGVLINQGTWDDNAHGTLQAIDLFGNSASSVYYDDLKIEQYFIYKAQEPKPADGTVGFTMPVLQWTSGDAALFHDIYLGKTPDLTETNKVASRSPVPMYFQAGGFEPGVTYYWRVDEITAAGVVTAGDVWSFTAAPKTAFQPSPWDGAKWVEAKAPQLTWSPGTTAQAQEVYFGTNRDDVAAGASSTFKGKQLVTTYAPGALQANTTYYWRVDEVEAADTKQVGAVWSFTTLGPGGGVIAQYFSGMALGGAPVLTQEEDSINHTWGEAVIAGQLKDNVSARWTAVLEAPLTETFKLITTSDDGARLYLDGKLIVDSWVDQGATDHSATVKLVAGQTYRIVMEYYENGGGATAQLSWSSPTIARQVIPAGPLQLPYRAAGIYPGNQAVDVPQTVLLHWTAGDKAAQHQIYFSANKDDVVNGTAPVVQKAAETTFDPGVLEWNKTYYWRVDEVNEAAAGSPWQGNVWSFTTANFLVVEDFESYNDTDNRIYDMWVDGMTTGASGSQVGYTNAPFAEQVIVQAGSQSMPLDYNNVKAPYYSEAERAWSAAQNWTLNGGDTLVLFVRGKSQNNASQPLYVELVDRVNQGALVVNSDPAVLTSTTWTEWRIPLKDFNVNAAAVKKMVIGVGNRANPAAAGTGMIYLDSFKVIKTAGN